MLANLITSNATRQLLGILYLNHSDRFYIRELERLTKLPVNAVRRELIKLESSGFLKSKEEGKVKYYWANKDNPIFEELRSIILKTQVVGETLQKALNKVPGIKFAFVYGSLAQNKDTADSDIDLMIFGKVDSVKLHKEISKIEEIVKRSINYSIEEIKDNKIKKSAFIKRIIDDKKLFIIGSEDEFKRVA